jgi:Ca2+-dependent lipid-binding protein
MLHCSIKDLLQVEVWDEDTVSKDDLMGKQQYALSLLDIEDGKEKIITVGMEKKGIVRFQIQYTSLAH